MTTVQQKLSMSYRIIPWILEYLIKLYNQSTNSYESLFVYVNTIPTIYK